MQTDKVIQRDGPIVGILSNPASGRDVRRLIAQASVFHTAEKTNMIFRILSALGTVGVRETVIMPDTSGITSRIRHTLGYGKTQLTRNWPNVRFLEMPIEYSEMDTVCAVEQMVKMGVSVIVVLGGDGTHRVVAKVCKDTPLIAVSTGTNNAFPEIREATVAGIAAGLLAMEKVRAGDVITRNKVMHVELDNGVHEIALIDLCVSSECWIGTRALWQPESLRELFVTVASPSCIGLSSIAGYLQPVSRFDDYGLKLVLAPPGEGLYTVSVPIAPGLMEPVGIADLKVIRPGEKYAVETSRGTLAFDGERSVEFGPGNRPSVWLEMDGPLTVDIDRVMLKAAEERIFVASGTEVFVKKAKKEKCR